MAITLVEKKRHTEEDLKKSEIQLEKAKRLHMKINQFKGKIKEFNYEKEGGNAEDILKNI